MFTIMAKHNFFLPFIAYKMNLRRHEHDIVNRLFYEAGMECVHFRHGIVC